MELLGDPVSYAKCFLVCKAWFLRSQGLLFDTLTVRTREWWDSKDLLMALSRSAVRGNSSAKRGAVRADQPATPDHMHLRIGPTMCSGISPCV
jgi:hypothetical protein